MSVYDEISRLLLNQPAGNFSVSILNRHVAQQAAAIGPNAVAEIQASIVLAGIGPGQAIYFDLVDGVIDVTAGLATKGGTVLEGSLAWVGAGFLVPVAQPTLTTLGVFARSSFEFFPSRRLWTFEDISSLFAGAGVALAPFAPLSLVASFTISNTDPAVGGLTFNVQFDLMFRLVRGLQEG